MSLFITFEGGEGSGKSLQARALYRKLLRLDVPALLTHEPGGTPFGERLGLQLKWAEDTAISPLTELLLFNASRSQLITELIQPGLKNKRVVICDRYTDSTAAYQSYGRGLDLKTVTAVNNTATQGFTPGLTVLPDLPAEAGLTRQTASTKARCHPEATPLHHRVREGYLKLAAGEPERWLVIDASQSKEKIARIIWQRVSGLLSGQGS